MPKESDPLSDLLFERVYDGPKKAKSKRTVTFEATDHDEETEEEEESDDGDDDDRDGARRKPQPKPRPRVDAHPSTQRVTIEHLFRPAGRAKRGGRPAAPAAPKEQGREAEGEQD